MMTQLKTTLVAACLIACGSSIAGCSDDDDDGGRTATVIGASSVAIDTRMVVTRTGETAIGNLLADTARADRASGRTPDVALINGGFIRGGSVDPETFEFESEEARLGKVYDAGDLTDEDIAGWMPFPNSIAYIKINGTQLKRVLERSAAALPPDLRNDEGGWFLHISGMSMTVDCSGTRQQLSVDGASLETPGSRVTKLTIGTQTVFDSANSVDELASTNIDVLTTSFIAEGLDGHIAFKDGQDKLVVEFDTRNLVDIVSEYVEANSPISPAIDGRLEIVGDCGQPSTLP